MHYVIKEMLKQHVRGTQRGGEERDCCAVSAKTYIIMVTIFFKKS